MGGGPRHERLLMQAEGCLYRVLDGDAHAVLDGRPQLSKRREPAKGIADLPCAVREQVRACAAARTSPLQPASIQW